jgi:hypothetical protein
MALPATDVDALRTRYLDHGSYPENLRTAVNLYLSILETYKTRLASYSEDLFTPSPGNVEVPIKDVSPTVLPGANNNSVWPTNNYKNVHDLAKLLEYFGIDELANTATFRRRDPFSRCM